MPRKAITEGQETTRITAAIPFALYQRIKMLAEADKRTVSNTTFLLLEDAVSAAEEQAEYSARQAIAKKHLTRERRESHRRDASETA